MDAWGLVLYDWWCYFGHEVKATETPPPDNLTRWIITQSKGFTRKGIEKISRFVRAYAYFVLTSQVQARSGILGNSTPAVDAQQVFKGMFRALIIKDIKCIKGRFFSRHRHIYASKWLELKRWKDEGTQQQSFSEQRRHGNWLKQGHKQGYKKLPPPDAAKIVTLAARHDNPKMLTQNHNDEKLVITRLIVGGGLIFYYFW